MEPKIRYCTTSDGVDIALASAGEGPPLLLLPTPGLSHVQVVWEMFGYLLQPLAERFHLVWYDSRAAGLSDRAAIDFSMDALVRDLEAVIEAAGLTSFAAVAFTDAVPVAVTDAATRPEELTSLILVDGWGKTSDYKENPAHQAENALRQGDWVLYTETVARLYFGFENQQLAAAYAAYIRECAEPEALRAAFASLDGWDVTQLLPRVNTRTLVAHNRTHKFLPVQVGQRLAARIPNARFQVIDDLAYANLNGVITEFLGANTRDAPAPSTAFRTILFTDLVGHTEMMSRLGDDRGRDVLREHERITREVLKANGGTEVKTMGDGFMASFGSVTKAVECAVALQRAFAAWNRDPRPSTLDPLLVRVGLNAGEPIEEDGDLFGATVILASRIAAKADGGEILVADTVRGLCSGKGFLFADRGEFVAKGFEEPVRISEVSWRE
jgi:class 3 adenylate cyclase